MFRLKPLFVLTLSCAVAALNAAESYTCFIDRDTTLSFLDAELKAHDGPEKEIIFLLSPGVTLTVDYSLLTATLIFEVQKGAAEGVPTVAIGEKVFFYNPVVFRDATSDASGCIQIKGPWQDDAEVDASGTYGYWNPDSFKMACDLEIASPLSYRNETHYFQAQSIVIPSGRTLSLTCPVKNGKRLPNVSFEDETSTLAFAGEAWESFPEKYKDLLTSSSGHFVFESDVTIDDELTFSGSPTIEVMGSKLTLGGGIAQSEVRPILRLIGGTLDGGTSKSTIFLSAPEGEPVSGLEVEGETELRNVKLDALMGSGTVLMNSNGVSSIGSIHIKAGETLELRGASTTVALPFSRVYGAGTLSLNQVKGTPQEIDRALRDGGFIGTLIVAPTTYPRVDLSVVEEQGFPYAFAPQLGGIGQAFTVRLNQYANARWHWPVKEVERQGSPSLTLIESGAYAGEAKVPAFPEWVDFTFLRADGTPVADYKVEYGKETNLLTWGDPAYGQGGFEGLPAEVNQLVADLVPADKVAGKVTGPHTVEEAAEALRCFSGIAKAEARQEDETVVDLRVDYAFGISRLTVVDGGKNALVEVTLTSSVKDATPGFRVKPVLVVNGTALAAEPLTEEAIADRGLSAPSGAATRWFLVPLDNVTGPLSVRVE